MYAIRVDLIWLSRGMFKCDFFGTLFYYKNNTYLNVSLSLSLSGLKVLVGQEPAEQQKPNLAYLQYASSDILFPSL